MAQENSFFIWGDGGAQLTPEQIAKRRQIEDALLTRGVDTSPVGSWTQGLARVADAFAGSVRRGRLDRAEKANETYNADKIKGFSALLTGGSSIPAATPAPGAMGSSMPAVSSSGQVAAEPTGSDFNTIAPRLITDLAKDYNLTPEQAAGVVGQLGQESVGFSTLQETNPLVPGSRGGYGYAQWTGPRRKAFEQFAADHGLDPSSYAANYGYLRDEFDNSPEGAVLGDLRNAKDAQEAGRIFTDKFLRPGVPHYDSRAQWTNKAVALIPQNGGGVQVASLDPSIGMPAPGAAGEMAATAPGAPQPAAVASGAPAAPPLPPPTEVATIPTPASVAPAPQSGMIPGTLGELLTTGRTSAPPPEAAGAFPAGPSGAFPPAPSSSGVTAPNGQAIPQVIIDTLSDPRSNPQARAMAATLLQQAQARNQAILEQQIRVNDPAYQADLRLKQLQANQIANPTMSPAERESASLARDKFNADQSNNALTPDIKEYNFYANGERAAGRTPLGPLEWDTARRKASATQFTNNLGGNSNKFMEESDKAASGRLNDYIVAGNTASQTMGDVQLLADLGSQITTGRGAQAMLTLGPIAESLGIDIKGLGEAQAFDAVVNRMAPNMRPAGSGSSSDTDIRMFFKSLPGIATSPGGNEIINGTLQAVQQNKIDAAEIASKAYLPKDQGGITWQEAEKQIRALPNPYSRFKEYQKQRAAGAPSTQAPAAFPTAAPPPPQAGQEMNGYVFKGGNPADRSNWQKVGEPTTGGGF